MPLPTRPSRPPVPALIAIVLLALLPLRAVWLMVAALLDGEWAGLIYLPIIAVSVIVLRGLWQGGHGAYLIGVVIAVLHMLSAFDDIVDPDAPGDAASQLADHWTSLVWVVPPLVVLILLTTRQSRAFFNRR